MIVAIDGPAASGKGTIARRIAAHYGLPYMDSGTLYRAVARDMAAAGADLRDENQAVAAALALDPASLDDPFLRDRGVGEAASIVARHPGVRAALLEHQRNFAHQTGGAVLDGRDIGTVICPDADVKLFVTASPEERARRRYHEWKSRGFEVEYDDVLSQIRERDRRDRERAVSPLEQAEDARLLDTTHLDIESAFEAAVEIIDGAIGRRNG